MTKEVEELEEDLKEANDKSVDFNRRVDSGVKVKYTTSVGGQAPKQGLSEDFGTDLYLRQDTLIIPGAVEATIAGVGIHTEFSPEYFGMLISLRSSMAKLPISMANHVGVIEGTYRGEIKLPLRNTLSNRATGEIKGSDRILEWVEEDKRLVRVLASTVSEELHYETLKMLDEEVNLLGGDSEKGKQMLVDFKEKRLPEGTVLLRKGTRVAQAYLAPKHTIDWVKVDKLTDTERGTGGFGSTNNKEDK